MAVPHIVSFSWRQISGPSGILTNTDEKYASFTAPDVSGSTLQKATFKLTVKDSNNLEAEDEVEVTINQLPTANAGGDQRVNEGNMVMLDGTQSDDPDGTIESWLWEQVGGTPIVALEGSSSSQASFTAPVVASTSPVRLTFRLTVKDDYNFTGQDEIIITINRPPAADAGVNRTVNEGDTVTLDGSSSYDPDGIIETWLWEQVGGAPIVVLNNADTNTASFTAPDVSEPTAVKLTFKLTVTDNDNVKRSDEVKITINQPRFYDFWKRWICLF